MNFHFPRELLESKLASFEDRHYKNEPFYHMYLPASVSHILQSCSLPNVNRDLNTRAMQLSYKSCDVKALSNLNIQASSQNPAILFLKRATRKMLEESMCQQHAHSHPKAKTTHSCQLSRAVLSDKELLRLRCCCWRWHCWRWRCRRWCCRRRCRWRRSGGCGSSGGCSRNLL